MLIKPVNSTPELTTLKKTHLSHSVAPLDGMWLNSFVAQARHFGYYHENVLRGYYCLNEEGFVLQYFIQDDFRNLSNELFCSLMNKNDISGAFVSTAEPLFLGHCLDHFIRYQVNSFMYQLANTDHKLKQSDLIVLGNFLNGQKLDEAVSFAHAATGASEQWLSEYYPTLIEREEIFGYWSSGRLIAIGECRASNPYQSKYADLGMIVGRNQRNKGIATAVLKDLIVIANARALKPICSTEKNNLAAQKAITRAGFMAKHRILKFVKDNGSVK